MELEITILCIGANIIKDIEEYYKYRGKERKMHKYFLSNNTICYEIFIKNGNGDELSASLLYNENINANTIKQYHKLISKATHYICSEYSDYIEPYSKRLKQIKYYSGEIYQLLENYLLMNGTPYDLRIKNYFYKLPIVKFKYTGKSKIGFISYGNGISIVEDVTNIMKIYNVNCNLLSPINKDEVIMDRIENIVFQNIFSNLCRQKKLFENINKSPDIIFLW